MRVRSKKYVRSKENSARLKELIDSAKNHPKTLFVIVFDEAHYSATSSKSSDSQYTPYEDLARPWNSEEFPNVFVLQISATPWNLQTINTRISDLEVFQDPKTHQLIEANLNTTHRYKRGKFKLNEIEWVSSHESDLKIGKKYRLVVCNQN